MKLYKIDFTNTIGDYMVTVPTDSQFLIGISNGDSEADVELLDGETEITPEDEKIGAYTVFNFETDGTPFRKHLKANINGQKPATKYWDAHEYEITDSTKTATIAILDDDVFPGYEDMHPVPPTATTMTVKFKDASGNYSTTLIYTYNSVATSGGYPCSIWDAPTEIDEEITNAFPVPVKIRMKLGVVWGWNKIEPNYTGQSSTVNWKATPLVADIQIPYQGTEPYTDKLNIVVKCDKMSVAYRDETGITSTEAVEAVKESGQFLSKTKIGQDDFYVPDTSIMMADNKDIGILGGNFSISTTEEDGAATVLEAYADSENEELKATGVINGAEGLTIKNAILDDPVIESFIDGDEQEYTRQEITVKINGVEKNIEVLAHLLS